MATAIKLVSAGQGGGSSELCKYLSERERHPQREAKGRRELFGQEADGLTRRGGDHHLTRTNSLPQKKDVFHFVISPEKKVFEKSGATNKERVEVYKASTRQFMKDVEKEVGSRGLRWVAAIHLNTNTPHIHVLIHKDHLNLENQPRRFHRLPGLDRTLTLHNKFEQTLLEQVRLAPQRQTIQWATNWQYPDAKLPYLPDNSPETTEKRILLGKALLAKETLSGRDKDVRAERFEIDGKFISEVDLDDQVKQASISETLQTYIMKGMPGLTSLIVKLDDAREQKQAELRDAFLGSRIAQQTVATVDKIGAAIERPFIASERFLDKQEAKALRAIAESKPVQMLFDARDAVENWYLDQTMPLREKLHAAQAAWLESLKTIGKPEVREQLALVREAAQLDTSLTPILERNDINKLQEIYVREGDTDKLKELEQIRVTRSVETGEPIRTLEEMRRLEGQVTVLEAMQQMDGGDSRTLTVLHTIVNVERERFLEEQGITPLPVTTPQELNFVDRVATLTGDPELLYRFQTMSRTDTPERFEAREKQLAAWHPDLKFERVAEVGGEVGGENKVTLDSLYLARTDAQFTAPTLAELPEIER